MIKATKLATFIIAMALVIITGSVTWLVTPTKTNTRSPNGYEVAQYVRVQYVCHTDPTVWFCSWSNK